jgi:deoxyribonuclease-4
LARAVERGVERECTAIQIFNQSPRMWRPTPYGEEDFEAMRSALADSPIEAVLIHAVYLVNTASEDPDVVQKSLTSLIHSLRIGDAIGAHAVVLHPGSAKTGSVPAAISRSGHVIAQALSESERCPLHLEDTAGAGGTLGRSFEELASLLDAAGDNQRLGICLDSCHLFASGYDIRRPEGLTAVLEECDDRVGLKRLGSLHLNDSQGALGSNHDRHAILGQGELGKDGCAVFLSEPRFEGLPCVLETPGPDRSAGIGLEEVRLALALRERGRAESRLEKRS